MNQINIDILMVVLTVMTIVPLYKTFQLLQMLSTALGLASVPNVRKHYYSEALNRRTEETHLIVKWVTVPLGMMALFCVGLLWLSFNAGVEVPISFLFASSLIIAWQIGKFITTKAMPTWLLKWVSSLLIANAQNDLEVLEQDIEKLKKLVEFMKDNPDPVISKEAQMLAHGFVSAELEHLMNIQKDMHQNLDELTEAANSFSADDCSVE